MTAALIVERRPIAIGAIPLVIGRARRPRRVRIERRGIGHRRATLITGARLPVAIDRPPTRSRPASAIAAVVGRLHVPVELAAGGVRPRRRILGVLVRAIVRFDLLARRKRTRVLVTIVPRPIVTAELRFGRKLPRVLIAVVTRAFETVERLPCGHWRTAHGTVCARPIVAVESLALRQRGAALAPIVA